MHHIQRGYPKFLKRAALRARLVEQALHDGGADIASAHSTASRNMPMTFWTRLIWANSVRAALFGFRVRSQYARRASIECSRKE
jgi:hypothetical protein